ncbi:MULTISPECIES: lasso peptide biosynthesis PqqD family chaperone [Cytobacillus]|uniref:Lasso peptide biosynthesis PqqD family chaperone n=1 Tax=Cytobacillus stercorigallinarum TaxID=2762240 RepID=A0ABR8QU99_9BACI|nr:lasso peptide biosynthesis PqqD family chaperone [Cytobacillus stercorigallinarum]MBD7939105.1 lasso peptide biosynthesis PqqD family chaperone [Cytobacillus stercorigallinarum]
MIAKKPLSINDSVKQVSGNMVSDMNGEKVMLNIENGKYYNLGVIGGDIWGKMQETVLVSSLISQMQAEYEVEQIKCEEEVFFFLEQLLKEGLIEVQQHE